jgi:hypothetical protein
VRQNYEIGECDLRTGRIKIVKRLDYDRGFLKEGYPFDSVGPVRSLDPANPGVMSIHGEDEDHWNFTNGAFTMPIPTVEGNPFGMLLEPKLNRLWLLEKSRNSTLYNGYALRIFDWHTHALRPVLSNVSVFDFHVDRDLYAATARRDLSDYGKTRSVWTALPIVGNWKTGKSWNPLTGLVYATGIALRP